MNQIPYECLHVLIKLPNSMFFDGGKGVHDLSSYKVNDTKLLIMEKYDLEILDKYSWGLSRTYPNTCPDFSITQVSNIITKNLDNIYDSIS